MIPTPSEPRPSEEGTGRAAASLLAAVATILSGSSVAVSGVIARLPTFESQTLRYAIGTAVLLPVAARAARWPRLRRGEALRLIVAALTGAVLFNWCILTALHDTDPSVLGLIVGTSPVFVAFTVPLSQRRRPSRRVLLAASIVVAGSAVALGGHLNTGAGAGLGVLALCGEVVFAVVVPALVPVLGALWLSAATSGIAAISFLVLTAVAPGRPLLEPVTGNELLALGYLGIAVTAASFVAWYAALMRISPELAGLFCGLIPLTAVAATVLLRTGRPTVFQLAGAAVIASGLMIGLVRGGERRTTGAGCCDRQRAPE